VEECKDVAEALINSAERGEDILPRQPCDPIVMATHGHGGFQRWLMGSVTERLLEHSSLSVLIMRPREQVAEKSEVTQDNILQEVGLE
jgi:nucleotide-binding universal stress UspA family protein